MVVLVLLGLLVPVGPAGALARGQSPAEVASVCAGAPPAGFVDAVSVSAPFVQAVDCLAAYGLTRGDADGRFRPGDSVTRQQMALLLARFLAQATSGGVELPASEPADAHFDDLHGLSAEAREAVGFLAARDVVRGVGDGSTFSPAPAVTRAQMASFVARAVSVVGGVMPVLSDTAFPDVRPDDVHAPAIDALGALGVVRGYPDGRFGPSDHVTREQMAQFLLRAGAVLDEQDRWEGRFVDRDPQPLPEPPEPPDTGPQTPTDPTAPDLVSMVLGIDGAERVVGATVTVTVRLLDAAGRPLADREIGWAVFSRSVWQGLSGGQPPDADTPPPLDLDAAQAVSPLIGSGAPQADGEGRAEVVIDTEGFPARAYVLVVWVGPDATISLADADGYETIGFELVPPMVDDATFLAVSDVGDHGPEVHLLVSDTQAVRAVPAVEAASYRVDGRVVTRAAFLEAARPGDRLEVRDDQTGREYRLSSTEPPTAGIVEVRLGVRFVDPASGVVLSEDLGPRLIGQRYTVDGQPVDQEVFLSHVSTGDHLRLEVAQDAPVDWVLHLENRPVTGQLVAFTDRVALLDPNPEDDWPVDPDGLGGGLRVSVIASSHQQDDNVYRVDDAEPTDLDGFVAALEAVLAPGGGTGVLRQDRRAGISQFHLETEPPPPIQPLRGTVIDGDLAPALADPPSPWRVSLAVDDRRHDLEVVSGARSVIDGQLSTDARLREAVSAGDELACVGFDLEARCTQLRLTRTPFEARVVFVDLDAAELDLLLSGGYVLQRVDPRRAPFGVTGSRPEFRLEGRDGGSTLSDLLAALAWVDLDAHEVRIQLEDQGPDGAFVWIVNGLPDPIG